jgi:hypothetical protein
MVCPRDKPKSLTPNGGQALSEENAFEAQIMRNKNVAAVTFFMDDLRMSRPHAHKIFCRHLHIERARERIIHSDDQVDGSRWNALTRAGLIGEDYQERGLASCTDSQDRK